MSYPVVLTPAFWQDRAALVVGGGHVAERRTLVLLDAGASVTLVSPDLTPALAARQADFTWQARAWQPGDISFNQRALLIFAATNDKAVNRAIWEEGRTAGRLVNTADEPARSDFVLPGVVRRGPLLLTISTGGNDNGASPALTAHLRRRVETAIGPEYEELAQALAELRPTVQAIIPAHQRAELWQSLIESEALAQFRQGQNETARQLLVNLVKEAEQAGDRA